MVAAITGNEQSHSSVTQIALHYIVASATKFVRQQWGWRWEFYDWDYDSIFLGFRSFTSVLIGLPSFSAWLSLLLRWLQQTHPQPENKYWKIGKLENILNLKIGKLDWKRLEIIHIIKYRKVMRKKNPSKRGIVGCWALRWFLFHFFGFLMQRGCSFSPEA